MRATILAAVVLCAAGGLAPATAGEKGFFVLFDHLLPDDGPPPSAGSVQYGDDVVSRGPTAENPHWHGDDAVPLGLRWHDRGWVGTPAEDATLTEQAVVGASVAVVAVPPPVPVAIPAPVITRPRARIRVARVRRPKPLCIPAGQAAMTARPISGPIAGGAAAPHVGVE